MKRKFFDTVFSELSGAKLSIPRMLKYVAMNQSSVYAQSDLTVMAQQVRSILKTPFSEFFERMVSKNALTNFAAIDTSGTDEAIPELLTMSSVTIDLKHTPGTGDIFKSFPNVNDKILINLTGVAKRDRQSGSVIVTNADVLQNLFVRGQLTAVYQDDNSDWLSGSSTLSIFILKSYSMILSAIIARYYNLGIDEIQKVATICALHMDVMLGGSASRPMYISRWDWCPSFSVRKSITDACSEYEINGDFNINSMCISLSKLVSPRMESFNLSVFLGLCGRLGQDLIISRLALEFPPYWVYLLMSCYGGNKVPLIYHLNKDKALMREGSTFINTLLLSNSVLSPRFV